MTDIVSGASARLLCQPLSEKQPVVFDIEKLRKEFLEVLLSSKHKDNINSFAYHLSQIKWAVFGTLTWKTDAVTTGNIWADGIRKRNFFRLIRLTCIRHRIRPARLLFYGKSEWGYGKRAHFHFIIAQDGLCGVEPNDFCKTLRHFWTENFGYGTADVQPFDWEQHLVGILYQTKCEYDLNNDPCFSEVFSSKLEVRMRKNAFAETTLSV